jgi:hypothetical protein
VDFVTTKSTLLLNGGPQPSTFFSALLSDKFKPELDHKGSILIDRNPKKFDVILEYLRTGVMELPPDMKPDSLILEAEFYGYTRLADELKHKIELLAEKPKPFRSGPRVDGWYHLPEGVLEGRHFEQALMFTDKGTVLAVKRYFGTTQNPATPVPLLLHAALSSASLPPPGWPEAPKAPRYKALSPILGTYEAIDGSIKIQFGESSYYGIMGMEASDLLCIFHDDQTTMTRFRPWESLAAWLNRDDSTVPPYANFFPESLKFQNSSPERAPV